MEVRILKKKVTWREALRPIPLMNGVMNKIYIMREVVPVVFLPGVMGTKLFSGEKDMKWDPDEAWFTFRNYGWATIGAKKKRKFLIGEGPFDGDFLQVFSADFAGCAERGWDSVSSRSYGDLRSFFENERWPDAIRSCFSLPVHAFGYNWADSPEEAGIKLRSYIDDLIAWYRSKNEDVDGTCQQVLLVTHSTGDWLRDRRAVERIWSSRTRF